MIVILDRLTNLPIEPQRDPVEGDWVQETVGKQVSKYEWHPPVKENLAHVKEGRIGEVKAEANQRITASDWKVTRAQERADGSLQAVYAEREAIRTASDKAESDILALKDAEAVKAFTW